LANRVCVTEAQLRSFVSYYAPKRLWHRADRRTSEGRAQELALLRGWIEPLPPGSGYRVLVPATQTPASEPTQWPIAA
jgi:hypothetical protein